MKNKKILILIIILFLIIVGIYFLKNENKINNENELSKNELSQKTEKLLLSSEYTLHVEESEDYSLLTIQTNIITQPFEFQYDNTKFVLDTSNQIFDNAIIKEIAENKKKEISVNLESNEVYKFYFIKKSTDEIELGKTLIINK